MSYMVMQRYATAIREAYAGRADVAAHLARATELRTWLDSLAIAPALRAELTEPIRALEDAFADLVRSPETYARQARQV